MNPSAWSHCISCLHCLRLACLDSERCCTILYILSISVLSLTVSYYWYTCIALKFDLVALSMYNIMVSLDARKPLLVAEGDFREPYGSTHAQVITLTDGNILAVPKNELPNGSVS